MSTYPLRPLLLLAAMVFTIKAHAQPLRITHLTGNVYVFTTYRTLDAGPYPANGTYLVTDAGVALFDPPWDTTQTLPLLDSIQQRHHQPVVMSISTHFHADRTGSIGILKSKGIATWSGRQTRELCAQHKEHEAQYVFNGDTTFSIGGHTFSTWYPGEGHTRDNIVIWIPAERVLHGGCFVKSTESPDLGNLEDANVSAWKGSAERTIKQFRHPAYIIPGHMGWTNKGSLKHTLKMAKRYRAPK